MVKIETGVDRLVSLVAQQKKISLDDAAKKLGVPKEVVQEWADFLDEEGLITVQYSLSTMYLLERKLSKKEVMKKEKEYASKKQAFVRKVETTLKKLENETAGFEQVKNQYYQLKDDIGDEIKQVKDEIDELRHYEELKKSIDQDIMQQKLDYEKTINDIHRRIALEEKRYEEVLKEIGSEEKRIASDRKELVDVAQQEKTLAKRLDALKEVITGIKNQLESEEKGVGLHEERLGRLHDLAESLEKDLKEKREKELEPLLESSNKHKDKILLIQDEIVAKIKARKKELDKYETQGEGIAKRFQKFFEKKAETEKLVQSLLKQRNELRDDLQELILKAKTFDLSTKGSDSHKHIKELESKYNEFEKDHKSFVKRLAGFRTFISGKEEEPAPPKKGRGGRSKRR